MVASGLGFGLASTTTTGTTTATSGDGEGLTSVLFSGEGDRLASPSCSRVLRGKPAMTVESQSEAIM